MSSHNRNPGSPSTAPDATKVSGEIAIYLDRFHDIDEVVDKCWNMINQEISRRGYGPTKVQIHMALAEAIINACKHGNRHNSSQPIIFRWHFNRGLTFEIHDSGPGFDYQNLPDPTRSELITAENGRGIFIIRSMAHSVHWRDRGRHLIVSFRAP